MNIHFQPVLSLKQQSVVGLEALARPQGQSILELLAQAKFQGQTLQLDRLCRRRALETFKGAVPALGTTPLLFMNIAAAIIDEGVVGSGAVLTAVKAAGLEPSDVVLELDESKALNTLALKRFVDQHRSHGFLIALDDLGAVNADLKRLAQIRPHIFKVDRSLVSGVSNDRHKQEAIASLVALAHRIGAIVLAEGVETSMEVDACAALGVELFQGYHFCRPQAPGTLDLPSLRPNLLAASRRRREASVKAIQGRREDLERMNRLSEEGRAALRDCEPSAFEAKMHRMLRSDLSLECAYLLDGDGVQVTETLTGPTAPKARNRLFSPAPKGTDHSNKDYYFGLFDAELEHLNTDSYLSLATGKLCRTVATKIPHRSGASYVLCLDLTVQA